MIEEPEKLAVLQRLVNAFVPEAERAEFKRKLLEEMQLETCASRSPEQRASPRTAPTRVNIALGGKSGFGKTIRANV